MVLMVSMKIGEGTAELTADLKKSVEANIFLKVSNSDTIKEIKFTPNQDLKKGDKVKFTLEKVN